LVELFLQLGALLDFGAQAAVPFAEGLLDLLFVREF
jgi:hypothetical protein